MTNPIRLCRLCLRQRAEVVQFAENTPLQVRLRSLGLTEGTEITALFRSPFGDPTAYLVKDSVIALRKTDCEGIFVRVTGDEHD